MKTRFAFLDGLRALAAGYVVLHHSWLTAYPGYPVYDGPAALGWLAYGQLAVSVFIVLSGFSLSLAPARHGWELTGGVRTYLRRRAWRILPTYWAALALSCVVFGLITPASTGAAVSLRGVVVHALLLQDVIDSPKPNGAFWSIAVEWQIYFLFPLLLLVLRRLGVLTMALATAAAVVSAYLLATHVQALSPLLNLTPQFLMLFALGIVAARVSWSGRAAPALAAGAGLLLVILLATHDLPWVEAQYFWVDLVAGVATAAALSALASGRLVPFRRFLASRPLAFTGRFSYSIYCVHLPLLWLVWHFALAPLKPGPVEAMGLLTMVGVPVVLVGSYCFSRFFERPFLEHRSFSQLRDHILGRKKPPDVADMSTELPSAAISESPGERHSVIVGN